MFVLPTLDHSNQTWKAAIYFRQEEKTDDFICFSTSVFSMEKRRTDHAKSKETA